MGPIRIPLVYPPGGVSDGILRLLAEQLACLLAVPVRLECRPGASGSLGLEALAAAAPDGRTLAFTALSPTTLLPQLVRLRYEPLRDFQPVASVMPTSALLVGTSALAGHFELLPTHMTAAPLQHICNGQLKPLAVGAPQLNAALNLALASPPLQDALRQAENLPTRAGVDRLAALIHHEHAQHRAWLQSAPIKLE